MQPAPHVPESAHSALLKLARQRTVNGMPRDSVEGMKATLKDALRSAHMELQSRLTSRLGQRAGDLDGLMKEVFEAAGDLGPRDSELDMLRASKAYVKPVKRYLGRCPDSKEDFFAYDAPLDETLEAMFPMVWTELKSTQEKMQGSAEKRQRAASSTATEYSEDLHISDVWDGVEFQKFMFKVCQVPGRMPLVFMFYYDGLEVANGLGQARTTHELGCFYWALLNLSQEKRMNSQYIRMATVCYKRAIGACGMHKVVSGPTESSEEGLSWVEWMIRLDKGLTLKTPDGPREFGGGTAMVAADTPAAAELMGTKKSVGPSTKGICRNCHASQVGKAHRAPNSFLASQPGWKRCCPNRSTKFRLRSAQDLKDFLQHLRNVQAGTMSRQALQDWMQDQGVNTFIHALWQLPHFSKLAGCPMDMMHIWMEGVARMNLGAISFWLHRVCKANLYELPDRMAQVARSARVSVHDFPHMNNSRIAHLSEGAEGSVPASDCSFPGTAAQISHVILHIPAIFGAMVPENQKQSQVWQLALLTCKIARLLWQRSFSTEDLLQLDKSIWLHDTLILGSPFLQHLWKPKNHYLSHIPLEILLWGPPRTYWCMAFEHENQSVKHGTQGNFANPVWSAAESKSLRVALVAEEAAEADRRAADRLSG